jgi:hypothetical protein
MKLVLVVECEFLRQGMGMCCHAFLHANGPGSCFAHTFADYKRRCPGCRADVPAAYRGLVLARCFGFCTYTLPFRRNISHLLVSLRNTNRIPRIGLSPILRFMILRDRVDQELEHFLMMTSNIDLFLANGAYPLYMILEKTIRYFSLIHLIRHSLVRRSERTVAYGY